MENPVILVAEGSLGQYVHTTHPVQVPAGISAAQAAAMVGIPQNKPWAALVNGLTVAQDTILQPGDTVRLLPIIAGG